MRPFGRARDIQRHGNVVRIEGDGATLEQEALGERLVRARLVLPGAPPAGQTVALPASQAGLEPRVHVDAEPLRIDFQDGMGNVLVQCTGLAWEQVDGERCRVQARFRRAFEEHYYGLGQAGPSLDKDGTTRRLWNSHYGYGPGTDMAVPLVLSSRGYGLFFDNSWDSEIALGRSEETASLVYTAEGGMLQWYVLSGPEPATILAEYARLTGPPPMPPRWALGYIQSTRHFERTEEIVELAQTLRDKRMPCDAIVFLSTYGDDMGMNNGVGTLEFHPRLWADPAALLRALKDRHLRVVSHEYPVVSPKSAHFKEADRLGYLVDYRGSESSVMFNEGQRFLDYSQPDAAAWWWAAHAEMVELGVDGWWLDGGEGPPSSVHLQGGSAQALHNVFDLYRQQAFFEGEASSRPEQRPFLLCRSGYAGMQRFGSATWSGDISNTFGVFEAQLPLGLSTALSGVPYWGTDIGGFFHTVPESPELFVRWFQFAAFTPLFRSHGRGIGHRGWREHLPWAHGPAIEDICRAFTELRYRLFPYNYSLAWQAHQSGMPLMRPLVLEFPDDPNVADMSAQYLWGGSFLVAPVTRGGATHWPVYLPAGTWYDFWTHQRFEGGSWIEADAPLERMPLFVRGGAIVPLGPSVQYLGEPHDGALSVLIYPRATSSFEVYEDDGETRAYLRGEYAVTHIECVERGTGISLTLHRSGAYAGAVEPRSVVLQVFVSRPPTEVTIDGVALAPLTRAPGRGETGWWHDAQGFAWIGLVQSAGETVHVDLV